MEFTRFILLPSNGLSYNKIAEVSPFTFKSVLSIVDPFFAASDSELMINILNQHVKNINVLDLYYQDAYNIWIFLYNHALEEQTLKATNICHNCQEINRISTPAADINIKFLDKNSQTISHDIVLSNYGTVTINRSRRKLIDNLLTGYNFLQKGDNDFKEIDFMIDFMSKQVKSVTIKGKTKLLDEKEFHSFMNYVQLHETRKMFELFRQDDFGVQNDLFYKCTKCSAEQKVVFSDPYYSCFYNSNNSMQAVNNVLKQMLVSVSSKLMRYDEILKVNYSMNKDLLEQITEQVKLMNNDTSSNNGGSPLSGTHLGEATK